MVLSMIVAMAQNRVIGKENRIPWDLPADRQKFREITMGKPVIMGRKTFESIGRPLPGRHNVIVTRQQAYRVEGCTVVDSPEAALTAVADCVEAVVIGGTDLYQALLPQTQRLYLTFLDEEVAGDVFFPPLNPAEWREVWRERHEPDERHAIGYDFVIWESATH